MNFLLVIIMSSAYFLPSTILITPFDSMLNCQTALNEAKKQWVTVDLKSYCIDTKKQAEIQEAKKKLKELESK